MPKRLIGTIINILITKLFQFVCFELISNTTTVSKMAESDAPSTQLADNRPQFDTALRVALPANVPSRSGKRSRDDLIRLNSFSPEAQANGKTAVASFVSSALAQNKSVITRTDRTVKPPIDASLKSMDEDAQILTSIRDLSVLAFSSRRAGKRDIEANAYLSLGVIYDNQCNFLSGIENYKMYLEICDDVGDLVGCALACNCLGVNFMMLVSPPSDAGIIHGIREGDFVSDYLSQAIFFHSKHAEIGDTGGRFVANSNLGICYAMVGDIVEGAKHQQEALRGAIKMQTLYGQSIAVGNLGVLALMKKDHATARTCFEQVFAFC